MACPSAWMQARELVRTGHALDVENQVVLAALVDLRILFNAHNRRLATNINDNDELQRCVALDAAIRALEACAR